MFGAYVDGHASRFKRSFLFDKAFADGARQTIFGIDCAHSKSPHYSGVHMHLVGRGGNLKIMTIALALVPSEDGDNYSWFFGQARRAGLVLTGVPMICDRSQALLSVAETFDLNLKYCTQHILRNVTNKFRRLTQHRKNPVWRLQESETKAEYEMCLSHIELGLGVVVRRSLEQIDAKKWCVHANIGAISLYGWCTSNFVESVFGTQTIADIRALRSFAFFDRICRRLVDDCYARATFAVVGRCKG